MGDREKFEKTFKRLLDNSVYGSKVKLIKKIDLERLDQQNKRIKELEEENQQLKQSQNQLAISVLLKVYQIVKYYNSEANKFENNINTFNIEQYIDDQIKELRGE